MSKDAAVWKSELSKILQSINANFVTVEISFNGKTAVRKMKPGHIMSRLLDGDCISSNVAELGVSSYGYLYCEHITKIIYNKKTLYEKEI